MLLSTIEQRILQIQSEQYMLNPQQLRSLCYKQQQQVMNNLSTFGKIDIYSQIAKVCPGQADLKLISNEQLMTRMNSVQYVESFDETITYIKQREIDIQEDQMQRLQVPSEEKYEGFCAFSQPSIKNFLEEIEDNYSIWEQIQRQCQ